MCARISGAMSPLLASPTARQGRGEPGRPAEALHGVAASAPDQPTVHRAEIV
jgi:hypothetical protein